MPVEISCVCKNCGQPQTVTIAGSGEEYVTCLQCGSALFKSRGVAGYLYILSNPSMPGLLKIGLTTRSVSERVAELSSTGVPSAFNIEACFATDDPRTHESAIHHRLAESRLVGKEFFRVSVEAAIEAACAVTRSEPLGQHVQRSLADNHFDDRGLKQLQAIRDQVAQSGRAPLEIWSCRTCQYPFFGPSATGQCPRGCAGEVARLSV